MRFSDTQTPRARVATKDSRRRVSDTYVIDVRDDGHVTDVLVVVHLLAQLIDGELRGERESETGQSPRSIARNPRAGRGTSHPTSSRRGRADADARRTIGRREFSRVPSPWRQDSRVVASPLGCSRESDGGRRMARDAERGARISNVRLWDVRITVVHSSVCLRIEIFYDRRYIG